MDQVSENINHQPQTVSRQVRRQAHRADVKRINRFQLWEHGGYGSEALPIIPLSAKLAPTAQIKPAMLGKIPGSKGPDGYWHGFGGQWSKDFRATLKDLKAWHASNASVGLQTRIFHAIDIDVEDEKLARDFVELAAQHIGNSPIRYREGSHRRLMLCRIKDGEMPLRKRRLKFQANGAEHAIELLGFGQQCVVEGPHPKGGKYLWTNGHPCKCGPNGLPEITKAKADAFFAAAADLLDMYGYPVVAHKEAGNSPTRTGLDNPRFHAPGGPEQVLELLRQWRPEHLDHEDYVQALVAIKASLGNQREEFRGEVLEWSPGVRSQEPDQFAARWRSITDASIGWEWLTAQARAVGYREDAQHDFNDGVPAFDTPTDPGNAAKKQMVDRFVWVKGLGQYNDTEDASFVDGKTFNAINVDVARFGSSGQQSAEAIFQNEPGARKVATATSRPGEPVILDETNDRGIPVRAVNLWRPSLVEPDLSATDTDAEPWLDLVNRLFGANTPEREHFLRWWAYVLGRPGEKIGHALVIIGGQGVGKDTVLRPLFEAVGLHNVASIDTAALMGQFNPFLKAQIIYAQELITYGRRDLYNTLKPYISAQATRLVVNEKNLRQYYVPNNQNWIVTSNYDNAIALEDDDRRFWVHRVLIEEAPNDTYFSKLYAWFKSGGTEKVFGWLKCYDLAGFNPMAKPPLTAAKQTMLDASQPAPVRWLREQLRDGGSFAQRCVLTVGDLVSAAKSNWDAPTQWPTEKQAVGALKAEGFKVAHRVRIGNAMASLWARGLAGTVTADAMRAQYQTESGRETPCKAA